MLSMCTACMPLKLLTVFMSQIKTTKRFAAENQLWLALQNVDYRFVFIPVIFISLRIWTCIESWLIFAGYRLDPNVWLNQVLFYLAVSVHLLCEFRTSVCMLVIV